jgi:hypothetical protein
VNTDRLFQEDLAVVPTVSTTAESLVPHLKKCGYDDTQIQRPFNVDRVVVPVAAFAGRPFDSWSACIAAVNLNGNSKDSAATVQSLGASIVFVCGSAGIDWWAMGPNGPTISRPVSWSDVAGVFQDNKDDLAPSRIYNAKLRRPIAQSKQLWFFDAGLMPAVELNRGETLLRLVEIAIDELHKELSAKLETRQGQEDAYRTVFWLLAAKVLHDKRVENFIRIDLKNVDEVFDRIGKHHGETDRYPPFGREGRRAIDSVAATFERCGSLADVSSESLAFVYENALIDKAAGAKRRKKGEKPYDIRKELGIHSTPSTLIHHMLSQMWGLIEEIKPEDRDVFEPACGPAPFLTASMRWLREWNRKSPNTATHDYLRSHLHGLEADGFAIELAKLALTLADEPHGNSWQLTKGDMFLPGVLAKQTKKAHVLLANPPYEAFTPAQRSHYAKLGEAVTAKSKATEMLLRALPQLPSGGVFGVVMPQGILHDKESRAVRERLLADFDLSEISVYADSLFEHGDHEVAVLIGRRKRQRTKPMMLQYRRVREQGMAAFKDRMLFSLEREVSPSRFVTSANATMWIPDLVEIWDYLAVQPRLGNSVFVQQGRQYWHEERLEHSGLMSKSRKAGFVQAVLRADVDYSIYDLPKRVWIDQSRRAFRTQGGGARPGHPQVVVNYNPVSRSAWRLKAAEDDNGFAISSNFVVFRPIVADLPLRVIWAVLNSPVANAYAYSWSSKRHMLVGEWRSFPLPVANTKVCRAIEHAASAYLSAIEASESAYMKPKSKEDVRTALLALDAEVLKLYDLPVGLERQLLELFAGVERKGVGCDFHGYPAGWISRHAQGSLELPNDGRPVWERIASLAASLPDEMIAHLPIDGATNHDHYLYGASKQTP